MSERTAYDYRARRKILQSHSPVLVRGSFFALVVSCGKFQCRHSPPLLAGGIGNPDDSGLNRRGSCVSAGWAIQQKKKVEEHSVDSPSPRSLVGRRVTVVELDRASL